MNATPRFETTKIAEVPRDMRELESLIQALPDAHRVKLEAAFARVSESTCRRHRILSLVQEALSQLRLDMKYLVFDLEATRRERDAYRSASDDQGE